MQTVTKKELLKEYDIVKVESNQLGCFDTFYGVTDESEYDFDLEDAGDNCKDTVTFFDLDGRDIIVDYSIINYYGNPVEREEHLKAEQFIGKKFIG